jgi:hypothetical protein
MLLSYFVYFLLTSTRLSFEAPVANMDAVLLEGRQPSAQPSTVGFVPQSGGRDTLSLTCSRLLTLSLCVYTAVPLNILPKNERLWKIAFAKRVVYIVGLFGPELVPFTT